MSVTVAATSSTCSTHATADRCRATCAPAAPCCGSPPGTAPRPGPDLGPRVHPHARPGRLYPGRLPDRRHHQGQRHASTSSASAGSAACRPPGRHRRPGRGAVRRPVRCPRSPRGRQGRPNAVATFTVTERHAQPHRPDGHRPGRDLLDHPRRRRVLRVQRRQRQPVRLPGNGSGTLTALGNTATDPGTVDAAATPNGHYLYVQTGANGIVDGFRVAPAAHSPRSARSRCPAPSAARNRRKLNDPATRCLQAPSGGLQATPHSRGELVMEARSCHR